MQLSRKTWFCGIAMFLVCLSVCLYGSDIITHQLCPVNFSLQEKIKSSFLPHPYVLQQYMHLIAESFDIFNLLCVQ